MDQIRTCIDRRVLPTKDTRLALLRAACWSPGYNLPIAFIDGDTGVQAKVREAALEWTRYARIAFNFIEDPAGAQIRISFTRQGSWSMIGKECLTVEANQPTMNFGWLTPSSTSQEIASVVLHEFGHALGCFHEHQHPAGGIPWNKQAVYDYYGGAPNYWDKATVDRNIFQAYDEAVTMHTIAPDPLSIMMYPIDKRLTDGKYEVGFNTCLSDGDKAFIKTIYL